LRLLPELPALALQTGLRRRSPRAISRALGARFETRWIVAVEADERETRFYSEKGHIAALHARRPTAPVILVILSQSID